MIKYTCSLILALFFSQLMLAQDTIPLWFSDDFEDNVNRWYQVMEYNEYTHHNALYINPDKDFRLVAEFDSKDIRSETRWGMIWGRKNGYSYYQFDIKSDGEFQIGYRLNGEYNALQPWRKKRRIIKPDYNRMEVRKKGDQLIFLINDQQVYKMPFMKFYNTAVGLKTLSRNVKFKKFEIYQDMGEINVAESVKDLEVERENLGEAVNSPYIDKRPIISPDGKTLFFIVEDHPDGYGRQDIYFTQMKNDGSWTKAQNIGKPLNNHVSNFVNTVLPDNNSLLIINAYQNTRDQDNAIIALTHKTREGWSTPDPKVINNLQKTGNWVSFCLAADGKTLIFSMRRPDSYGGRDLYVSFLMPNGQFSTPKNLGKTINTPANEHCPFLAADGKTLYFDTDGHAGYGGRDIFVAKRLDESWTNWSTPQNMGPIINTPNADEGLMIPASGEYAYFVSDENSFGGYDIYRLKLPPELRPEPTALLSGRVWDCMQNLPVGTTLKVYKDKGAAPFALARTNPQTGEYKLALAGGAKYRIVADYQEGDFRVLDTLTIDLTDLPSYEERKLEDICTEPINPPQKPEKPIIRAAVPDLKFDNVYFASAQWDLNDSAKATLNDITDSLKKYPQIQVEIVGHTDSIGSFEYNWSLAIKRSSEVIGYLEALGIERARVAFKGKGETKPAQTNQTPKGRATNRRVEIRVIRDSI